MAANTHRYCDSNGHPYAHACCHTGAYAISSPNSTWALAKNVQVEVPALFIELE